MNGGETLVIHITTLCNIIFSTGKFPEIWREGLIIPIHKKNDINDVNNYRGVTLLGTLGKLFTALLNNRLQFWVESHSVYVEAQRGGGGGSGKDALQQTVFSLSIINSLISQNKTLYCAFLDLRKAFDCVDRNSLWLKRVSIALSGNMYNIIHNMY